MFDEPANLYSDTVGTIRRNSADEVFLVRMEARPNPENDESQEIGGGFVNCWINVDELRDAELRSIALIQENEWSAVKFEKWELVRLSSYAIDTIENEDCR
jgi:hypothetical protein